MAEQIEHQNGRRENLSAIHATFIQRCISIAHQYGSDLALKDHEVFHELPEGEYSPDVIIGKRYSTRMPHLAFANRWLYTQYNQQGASIMQGTYYRREGTPFGAVQIEHVSMGQPTDTGIIYEFGDDKLVYSCATIDNEQPPTPSVLSFMEQVGVPVVALGWDGFPPYDTDSWDSQGPISAMHVLAIMRVVNSQFQK